MFDDKTQSAGAGKHKSFLLELLNTLEWLTTAFMLAFVFRAFVMEAFRIPTGSMADTLKGAHFRLQCPECGYSYEHGFIPENYGLRSETVPLGKVPLSPAALRRPASTDKSVTSSYYLNSLMKCSSCGYYMPPEDRREVYNGDRILVLKSIYQFFEPQRWDVVVFKNPLEPKVSYIKRLIAKPGETIEIIDGDIYIDGRIMRKPPKVQEELWSVICDNDYRPAAPGIPQFNGRQWKEPFENAQGSTWSSAKEHPTMFSLDSAPDAVNTLRYNTSQGNDFLAVYSYNQLGFARWAENCSDLKMRFYAAIDGDGSVGATLGKYDSVYKGIVHADGRMAITRTTGDAKEVELQASTGPRVKPGSETAFGFASVDHKLILEFGDRRVEVDMGSDPNGMGAVPKRPAMASAAIVGSGKVQLSHIALLRDIHYLSAGYGDTVGRGCRGKPFTLKADEFFVLGDNSPNSQDCRWWATEGIGNDGIRYRAGIVPRDYLVGKAVFVYWPSGYSILESFPLLAAPDFGHMRFVYGGSDRML